MIAFNGIDTVGYNDHVLGGVKRKENEHDIRVGVAFFIYFN